MATGQRVRRLYRLVRLDMINRHYPVWARISLGAGLALMAVASIEAQQGSALEPTDKVIRYLESGDLADPLTQLERQLPGKPLAYEPMHGYLLALLKELHVPRSSQALVFSKTSNQAHFTSPSTPRAIYYSDQVYIGWAQGDPTIDVAAIDPKKGAVFFTVSQKPGGNPQIVRNESCLSCHVTPKTLNVPGVLLKSVYANAEGKAIGQVNGFVSGHNNPLAERWGGWYVTGTHSSDIHMGNAFLDPRTPPGPSDLQKTSQVTDLSKLFDTSKYLSPFSDTVALLVLDHASRMQNMITLARYETMYALADKSTNAEYARDRIKRAGEQLLAYMLFRNEAPLKGEVRGVSSFQREFQKEGPRDHRGRSLREFDLRQRLFKYPCSYMIYTPAFDALPKEMKDYLWQRLRAVLHDDVQIPGFKPIAEGDRKAVYKILADTKPEFRAWLAANAFH
jgi:hypothetical protein